jgi:hypothetical protein
LFRYTKVYRVVYTQVYKYSAHIRYAYYCTYASIHTHTHVDITPKSERKDYIFIYTTQQIHISIYSATCDYLPLTHPPSSPLLPGLVLQPSPTPSHFLPPPPFTTQVSASSHRLRELENHSHPSGTRSAGPVSLNDADQDVETFTATDLPPTERPSAVYILGWVV